jgi:hypothetical protein
MKSEQGDMRTSLGLSEVDEILLISGVDCQLDLSIACLGIAFGINGIVDDRLSKGRCQVPDATEFMVAINHSTLQFG